MNRLRNVTRQIGQSDWHWIALLAAIIAGQCETRVLFAAETAPIVVREPTVTHGWTLYLSRALLDQEPQRTGRAVELLGKQLQEIKRVVPPRAVSELQKVPLYFNPQYPKVAPRAEYHPNVNWLRENHRNPHMAKSIEFTNVLNFAEEQDRMPNFVLHELSHAFHDRVLPGGFANAELKAAYERGKRSGIYATVERYHGRGNGTTREQAYGMSNPMEYFAESSEAFFGRNDFYPFTQGELLKHDPEMHALVGRLWGVGR
ncbi:MAG: hypothetical protein KDB23_04040 [Planctomycetales bacterium]|nr:hypothetical protein [Planctomycetales bacterium]